MRDGNVVEDDSELFRPFRQFRVDGRRDDLSLRDELPGVKSRHHRFQNLHLCKYGLNLVYPLYVFFSQELLFIIPQWSKIYYKLDKIR